MAFIIVGLKVAMTLAVIGAVIGEFVGAEDGLGYLVLASTSQSRTLLAFAARLLLTAISAVLYLRYWAHRTDAVPWAPRS
jgi:NitT/TauT family transport system permease protein